MKDSENRNDDIETDTKARKNNNNINNYDDDGQLSSSSALLEIVQKFPQDNLVHAFGYGSGVFSQTLNENQKHEGMLDIIFVVDDAHAFHKASMETFPHHYATWLLHCGPDMAARMQRNFLLPDAHVLFHVVNADNEPGVAMKYGVVHIEDLTRDLAQWESLYLAGRMQKPTLAITPPPDALVSAQKTNLTAAIAASLLLLENSKQTQPDTTSDEISWVDFYSQLASLSYTGDFRMQVGGEDPMKIKKLVQAPGQLERFQSLYRPILKPLETKGILSIHKNTMEWNSTDLSARNHLQEQLPPRTRGLEGRQLAACLASIVAPAARNQSLKGITTLGFRRSIQYASAKLSKGLLRKKS